MFCFKCGEIVENEKCLRCDNNSLNQNSLDLSPICFGFLPTESYGRTIMTMGQLFDDQSIFAQLPSRNKVRKN